MVETTHQPLTWVPWWLRPCPRQLELPDDAVHQLFSANRWEMAQSIVEDGGGGAPRPWDQGVWPPWRGEPLRVAGQGCPEGSQDWDCHGETLKY